MDLPDRVLALIVNRMDDKGQKAMSLVSKRLRAVVQSCQSATDSDQR